MRATATVFTLKPVICFILHHAPPCFFVIRKMELPSGSAVLNSFWCLFLNAGEFLRRQFHCREFFISIPAKGIFFQKRFPMTGRKFTPTVVLIAFGEESQLLFQHIFPIMIFKLFQPVPVFTTIPELGLINQNLLPALAIEILPFIAAIRKSRLMTNQPGPVPGPHLIPFAATVCKLRLSAKQSNPILRLEFIPFVATV